MTDCPVDGKSCPVQACATECQAKANPAADPILAPPEALLWAQWGERLPLTPPATIEPCGDEG